MYKVMIVDDEDIIVSGLVKVMPWAKYGCEVAATASDGLAAQAVLREKRPDILFTDICMPGADGLEMCIRDRAITGSLKVFDLPWTMFVGGLPVDKSWLTEIGRAHV